MTPEAWVREQLVEQRPSPMTKAEMLARHAELRESAKAACGAQAESALRLLRLVRNGVMTVAEI